MGYFLLCLALVAALSSFPEWAFHYFVMHRKALAGWFPGTHHDHAVVHHGHCYGADVARPRDGRCRLVSIAFTAGSSGRITLAVALCLLPLGWQPALAVVAWVALHHLTWNAYHLEMHDPAGRWFARCPLTRWHYRLVARAHVLHHWHDRGPRGGCNYGAMTFGLADRLLGTHRKADADDAARLAAMGL
jgi:hypothetical protein